MRYYLDYIFIGLYTALGYSVFYNSIDFKAPRWMLLALLNLVLLSVLTLNKKYSSDFYNFIIKKFSSLKSPLNNYLIFIFFSLLSFFVAYNLKESLITLSNYLIFFFGLIIVTYFVDRNLRLNQFVFYLILVTLLVEIIFSLDPLIRNFDNIAYRSRDLAYLGSNVNITAFSILIKVPFLIYVFLKENKWILNLFYAIFLSLSFFIFPFLGTRAAILTLWLLTLITIPLYFRSKMDILKKVKVFLPTFFLCLITFITSSILKENDSVNRIASLNNIQNDYSLSSRLEYYTLSLNSIIEKPTFGIGLGNWKIESINWSGKSLYQFIVPYHAHNDFIQILTEVGIFGLIFYLLFFYNLYKKTIKFPEIINIVGFLSLSIYLIDSFFNFPISRPMMQLNLMLISVYILNYKKQIS